MTPSPEPSFRWKKFSKEDMDRILFHQKELYSLNFATMSFDSFFYSNIRQWYIYGIKKQHCFSNLLFNNDEMVGFYLFQLSDTTVYLMQMFVAKTFRGKGFGRVMLHHYEQYSKKKGATSSFLHASSINEKAVAFYIRNGYITMDQEFDEQGYPRFLMFKFLK